MKETLKRLLCMILALAVIFVFAACSTEEKAEKEEVEQTTQEPTQEETTLPEEEESLLVGKWECQIDISDFISDRVYKTSYVDLEFEACLLEIKATFEEDGSYKVRLKIDYSEALQKLDEEFIDTVLELTAQEVGMTVAQAEESLKAEGLSREELAKEFADVLLGSFYEGLLSYEEDLKGKWLLEGDKLYLDKKDPKGAEPVIITLENETFTVTEITEDVVDVNEYFLPLTFTRA